MTTRYGSEIDVSKFQPDLSREQARRDAAMRARHQAEYQRMYGPKLVAKKGGKSRRHSKKYKQHTKRKQHKKSRRTKRRHA